MQNFKSQQVATSNYDIVICGAGVAGLWLLNVLMAAGFSVLLIEKNTAGGTQTMASQGMIHGGQRYMLGVSPSNHAESVGPLPERWDACLEGRGEIDLRGVRVLSQAQLMWPTGGQLTNLALNAATHTLKAKMRKINVNEVPEALAGFYRRPIYELPEKVMDIASLVEVLSKPHVHRIRSGRVEALSREGVLKVNDSYITAQVVICTAGLGNEEFLNMLGVGDGCSQQRPIRQIMVKPMPFTLYGHGITTSYKPRITVTSHPLDTGGYVWYLGGAIADEVLTLSEDEAIKYAQKEMRSLFEHIDWSDKKWATWNGTRAEAFSSSGRLPNGPVIQEYDNVFVAWPTKLTLTPLLGDQVFYLLEKKGVRPKFSESISQTSSLGFSPIGNLPWEYADWTSTNS
jgi:glycine/D-amino acid oxidase-like deaminating enzyme